MEMASRLLLRNSHYDTFNSECRTFNDYQTFNTTYTKNCTQLCIIHYSAAAAGAHSAAHQRDGWGPAAARAARHRARPANRRDGRSGHSHAQAARRPHAVFAYVSLTLESLVSYCLVWFSWGGGERSPRPRTRFRESSNCSFSTRARMNSNDTPHNCQDVCVRTYACRQRLAGGRRTHRDRARDG